MNRWAVCVVALVPLLTACDKRHSIVKIGTTPVYTDDNQFHFLVMGQSNAVRFSPNGVRSVEEAFGSVRTVNCAVGSTMIGQWIPPERLYMNCVNAEKPYKPTAIFWYQGESDAWDYGDPDYAHHLTNIFDCLKRLYPGVKIVFAQIARNDGNEPLVRWEFIKQQQASICMRDVMMVKTDDLALEPADGIHLTPASQTELGRRVAVALHELGV